MSQSLNAAIAAAKPNNIAVIAERLSHALTLTLEVVDRDTVTELLRHEEGPQRDDYALSALRLGVLALRSARGEIDVAAVKREGEAMVASVRHVMEHQATHIQATIGQTLAEYFNPADGKFTDRVERLVRKDGELERLIADRLTGEESDLTRRLGTLVGQGSPLLAKLDPDAADGVVSAIEATLSDALTDHRGKIVGQFSLDDPASALSRLVGEIYDKNGALRDELTASIDGVVKQFSLDDEQSALSRMKTMVERTNQAIVANLTLDDDASALARLKREVTSMLKEQADAQNQFFAKVKEEIGKLTAQKTATERTTLRGLDFEEALGALLGAEASRLGDVYEGVGATTGLIKHCKKGDFVVELGPESAAPQEKIVFEAKESGAYTLKTAREEMDEARRNRGASVGVFVFSKKTAPAELETISRYDNDIVVVWDRDAELGDTVVRIAYSLARALVVRRSRANAELQFDFEDVDRSVNAIRTELERLETIGSYASGIRTQSEKIETEVRRAKRFLSASLEALDEQLEAVKDVVRGPITESI